MHPAANCIFLFLQIILAPILYPYGYLAQILGILLLGLRSHNIQERERQLLDPLLLILLLSNIVLSSDLGIADYAARLAGVLLLCYWSTRLHDLSAQLMDPIVSVFLLGELLLSPHLYPIGYLAQLGLFLYLNWSTKTQKRKALDGPSPPSSADGEVYLCKICFENKVDACFLNCGHCACRSCCEYIHKRTAPGKSEKCPFCNTTVTSKVDLYLP